jgi:hypothetical protein
MNFTNNQYGIYLGIDPGVSGGISVISYSKVTSMPIPELKGDMWKLLAETLISHRKSLVLDYKIIGAVERVGGFIGTSSEAEHGKHRNLASAHTMFTMGETYGALTMALVAANIPYRDVLPKQWQLCYGMSKNKGESTSRYKSRLRDKAKSMFPNLKLTQKTGDSLLIAEWLRNVEEGQLISSEKLSGDSKKPYNKG